MHIACIKMSMDQLNVYSILSHAQFYCRCCAMDACGQVNFRACLSRIAVCAPQVVRMRQQAESEKMLLSFYRCELPESAQPSEVEVTADAASEALLSKHSPWLLTKFVPVHVAGDGNCLFRAVSFAMYGRESLHEHLQLLSCIEILGHPELCDIHSDAFYAPFQCDQRIVLSDYSVFVADTVRYGSYSDMLTVLSVSSVIQKPIQTRWPIVVHPGEASPLTQLVTGRGVTTVLPINVLRSVAGTASEVEDVLQLNHFVPLVERSRVPELLPVVSGVETTQPHVGSISEEEDCKYLPLAIGGQPLNGDFLTLSRCVSLLTGDDVTVLPDIPTGVKENVYFVVKRVADADSLETRDKFWDDCGAWSHHHGTKSFHLAGSCAEVRQEDDGAYCTRRRVDGKRVNIRMDPQQTNVLCIHRMYTKLSRDVCYRRRITYIDGLEVFLAEYVGSFPGAVESHGNATKSTGEYVRTRPCVLEGIADACKTNKDKPRKIYQAQQLADVDEDFRPRNKKQVENVAGRLMTADRPKSSSNLADELQTLFSRLSHENEDFVQAVSCLLRKAPSVVLYTQQQIDDITTFCCRDVPENVKSVFSVDRTFNLSSLFVTVTVFRHRKVVRKTTQEAPIFVGPMMLHGDGKFATYLHFFSTLLGALNGDAVDAAEFRIDESFVTGSDEETALVKALQSVFPQSWHVFCLVHCKDNVRHHMTAIGTAKSVREHVLSLLFGCSGVAESADEKQLDDRTAQVLQYVRQNNVDVVDYLQQRVLPKLSGNYRLRWEQPWLGRHQWTNNNCESANHVLKMQLDWKPARITDLVEHLRDVVRLQYNELRRALCGLVEFPLAPAFTHVSARCHHSYRFLL